MARLEDKIAEIADGSLRQAIAEEVAKLKKRTRFGLVYEEHQPEVVPMHGARIKRGERVALRTGSLIDIWRVVSVKEGLAHCERDKDASVRESFPVDQLIVVRRMGEAIYPALTPINAVKNGDPAQPHHVLIEADNYHALQLMLFPYEGKVDCIYIDPPYNTGAKDWKYNNDYVDGNDAWRHSKWLTFMAKRLRLAKRLLKPDDSVLIVTIDEKEYLNLGMLLRQEFPDARIQMVSAVINPAGVTRPGAFARTDEYIFFVFIGGASAKPVPLGDDWRINPEDKRTTKILWSMLVRTGTNARRADRPNLFYPIFVTQDGQAIHSVGQPPALGTDRKRIDVPKGTVAIWPIRSDGSEGNWQASPASLWAAYQQGFVRLGKFTEKGMSISYLKAGEQKKVRDGTYRLTDRRSDGSVIVESPDTQKRVIPNTAWRVGAHDASRHGSNLLKALVPDRKFPFPKSLYAVEDCLRFFVCDKPNAVILDFFSGSGTTAHAVMRLNHQDAGHRHSISITNNEVAVDEQKALSDQGLQPGHPGWEKWGICNYITYPRIAAAITGKTPSGEPIKGDYKFTDEFPMAEGFPANLEYFRLDFLDPQEVQMGRQFAAVLPILWMMAGARGPRPAPPDPHTPWLLPDGCPFAVLMQETRFKDFVRHVEARHDLTHIFIVTNSADTVCKLREEWPELRVVQLYKDYLENFRINLSESPAP